MRERKSALTNGKTIAGRFLLFLVLSLLLGWAQFWPPGLFPRLRVQILLRSLFSGSPRPPLPHERGCKHASAPLGSRSGGISGTGRAGGPGVRGPRGRPGRSCGFWLFPSRRLRGFSPSWDPGAVCSVLSVRFSAGVGGRGERKTPLPRLGYGERPPPRPSRVSPRFFKL